MGKGKRMKWKKGGKKKKPKGKKKKHKGKKKKGKGKKKKGKGKKKKGKGKKKGRRLRGSSDDSRLFPTTDSSFLSGKFYEMACPMIVCNGSWCTLTKMIAVVRAMRD